MLKANFKITETGGTGTVLLQSSSDGQSWTDVGMPLTLSYGHLTVDDSADITIDTDVFTPGQSYQFRLTDVAGSPVSNVVAYTIHSIISVTAGTSVIDLTDQGGGSYLFGLHASPTQTLAPVGATLTGYDYDVTFWHLQTPTPINSGTGATTDMTIPASGNTDGVYVASVIYRFSDDSSFNIFRLVKVDNTGAVAIDIQINGCAASDISGLQFVEQAHIIQTGSAYPIVFAALNNDDPDNVTILAGPVSADIPYTFTIPTPTNYIIYILQWDTAISDHFDHDFFPYHSIATA